MFVLITGKPGVGKTSILKLLNDDGYEIFSVDDYVKSIYKKNNIGYIIIKQKLGNQFVDEYSVIKDKLLEYASYSHKNYKLLCDIIWPIIKDKLLSLKKEKKFIVVEMSIYLLNREFFVDIFDKVIIIDRDKKIQYLTNTQKIFTKYFNETLFNNNDLIINNNNDLFQCYQIVKNIINKLFQRSYNSLFRPIDDGYYVNNRNVDSAIIIWPSIYNFQFSIDIKYIENTFIDAICLISRFVNVNLGVDLISYENVKNFLPSNVSLFKIHMFPFYLKKELLFFLENKVNNDTRLLISKGSGELYEKLFKKNYLCYQLPFKLNDNDILVIRDTLFIIKSKYDILLESYGYTEKSLDACLKLFFSVDDIIIISDDEGSNDNNIYKYINHYDNTIFYSYDENYRTNVFDENKQIITSWAEDNNYKTQDVKIIIFDNYSWLSYTNFVSINNNICIISLCEINDVLFMKKIKQLKINANVVVIDGSIYQTKYYYSINSIVLTIPKLKF